MSKQPSPAEQLQQNHEQAVEKVESKKMTAEEIKEKMRLERRKDFLQSFRIGGKNRIGDKEK